MKNMEREARAQIHLIDMLSYLESKVDISLFPGERLKCKPAG